MAQELTIKVRIDSRDGLREIDKRKAAGAAGRPLSRVSTFSDVSDDEDSEGAGRLSRGAAGRNPSRFGRVARGIGRFGIRRLAPGLNAPPAVGMALRFGKVGGPVGFAAAAVAVAGITAVQNRNFLEGLLKEKYPGLIELAKIAGPLVDFFKKISGTFDAAGRASKSFVDVMNAFAVTGASPAGYVQDLDRRALDAAADAVEREQLVKEVLERLRGELAAKLNDEEKRIVAGHEVLGAAFNLPDAAKRMFNPR